MLSLVIALFVASSSVFAQTSPGGPIKTTLCQLISDPERFNNKLVEIRSEFVSRFQWEGFVDETCSAKIQVDAYGVIDDRRAHNGQAPNPVRPKKDRDYRSFRHYADTKFKWPEGGQCQDCPRYRILVTATGRFDYFADKMAVAVDVAGDVFPMLRFVLQSVSDIAATVIDPSTYSGKERRDLTLEEAHELVTAFLKDHAEGRYGPGLEKYEVEEYPGFQFFQALPDPPSGRIHYAVDLKTGEVWDAPACDKLTSPSLKKLQAAVRNRVGLTVDEYRQIGRPGPFCEQ